ncbi:MAG: hypothetical protein JWM73_1330 [Solirubrobacterales bacterium]|nr:hypothetical protein [Solirubrobacterales bacterium]
MSAASSAATLRPLERLALALRVALLAGEERLDEIQGLLHEDLEVPSVPGVAPGRGYRGIDGFSRYFAEAAAAGFRAVPEITAAEVTETGNVLATGRLVCHVRDAVEAVPAWFVYRFRDDRVSAIETYTDGAWARSAAHDAT